MRSVQIVHWKPEEAVEKAAILERLGYTVSSQIEAMPQFIRRLRADPPAAVVIDLSRLPSQGRDLGIQLRFYQGTRCVPLVFVGGDPLKVEDIRRRISDAVYTAWEEIGPALSEALANPPENPVKPRSTMDGYAGRPLAQKLGIKPGSQVALVNAPDGFLYVLQELEPAADLSCQASLACNLILWFVRSRQELEQGIASLAAQVQSGKLWIIWAKKGSAVYAGLSQQDARDAGLGHGLVDFKVCAVDETWSGLLFTRRKERK